MAIAFSVLSLKRNRSTSTNSKAHSFTNVEPVSKLSKLKSGFSIFSKITQSLTQQQQDHAYEPHNNNNRRLGLFQYFRNNSDHDHVKYSKKAYDNDSHYEYNHYYNTKKSDNNQHHHERNIHTLPTATTKKLTGILIKRSGTNPTTIAFKHYQPASSYGSSISHSFSANGVGGRNRTYSNATISNMTINSEDLTAKEFADIAGIRILTEEEDSVQDDIDVIEGGRRSREEEMYYHFDNQQPRKFSQDEDIIVNNATVSSRYTTSNDHHERLSVLSYTSFQSHSTQNKFKIWDNEFWSHPEVSSTAASRNITPTSKTRAGASELIHDSSDSSLNRKLSTRSTTTTNKLVEPPILHELRRMNTTGNDSFIKKGRFEIHLGSTLDGDKIDPSSSVTSNTSANDENTNNNYTDSTLSFSDAAGVLEWKRKGKKTTLSS